MYRVAVGMQKSDGNRPNPLALERTRSAHHTRFIEWLDDPALSIDPPTDTVSQPPRHDRRGALVTEVVHVRGRDIASADLDEVAKAVVGDQARCTAFALEDRIQSERRAVHEDSSLRQRCAERFQRRQDAFCGPEGCGRRLGDAYLPGPPFVLDRIDEGAADVDRDPEPALEARLSHALRTVSWALRNAPRPPRRPVAARWRCGG